MTSAHAEVASGSVHVSPLAHSDLGCGEALQSILPEAHGLKTSCNGEGFPVVSDRLVPVSMAVGRSKPGEPRWFGSGVLVPCSDLGGAAPSVTAACVSMNFFKIQPLKKETTNVKRSGHLSYIGIFKVHSHRGHIWSPTVPDGKVDVVTEERM